MTVAPYWASLRGNQASPFEQAMLPVVWDYVHPTTGQTVRNVEALCRKHLNRLAAKLARPLSPADYAESLAHLLGEVVILADRYDPARSSGLGGYLDTRLPLTLIDHWRSYHGRNGERRVFDSRRTDDDDIGDEWLIDPPDPHDDPDDRRLGPLTRQITEDGPEARADAYRRFVASGDRELSRSIPGLGYGARRGAPPRHPDSATELVKEAA